MTRTHLHELLHMKVCPKKTSAARLFAVSMESQFDVLQQTRKLLCQSNKEQVKGRQSQMITRHNTYTRSTT